MPENDWQVNTDQVAVLVGELLDDMDAYLSARHGAGVRSLADVVAFNAAHAEEELAAFGQEYFEDAVAGGGRAAEAYQQARTRNVDWARDACLGPAFATGCDVLVAPAYRPAWKSDLTHGDQVSGGGGVCTPAAILGWPILTVPMGLVDGLPVGLSIVGQAGSEPQLLAVGHALERALGLVRCNRAPSGLAPADAGLRREPAAPPEGDAAGCGQCYFLGVFGALSFTYWTCHLVPAPGRDPRRRR